MSRLVIALFVLALGVAGASAHTRSQSASDWLVEGSRLEATFSIDARRATLLYGLERGSDLALADVLSEHLARSVQVLQDGTACEAAGLPQQMPAAEGYLRMELVFQCQAPVRAVGAVLDIGAFFDLSAAHLHILRVRSNGELIHERVLTGVEHRVFLGAATEGQGMSRTRGGFIGAGVQHVLSGWDHLAFLAALLLLAGRVRPIILTVTGFTLGHSLTMALVALGLLRPYGLAVELLIGFSIAYAAMEAGARDLKGKGKTLLWAGVGGLGAVLSFAAWRAGQEWPPVIALLAMSWFVFAQAPVTAARPAGWSWRAPALAALFGLAHGAGFAGALLEYDLGGAGLLRSLFGFNLGVELGQLCAIAVILLLFVVVRRTFAADMTAWRLPAAAGLFGLGVFWTVSRLLLTG